MSSPVLFSTGSAPTSGGSRNLIEFKAGKMELRGKMVHPLKKSGLVYLHQSPDDELMHFCWKDRQTGVVEDDLILFPDDCEFKHVSQCTTGRVYVLKMKSSNRKLFFWMQESKADKDEEYCNKINEYLNHPPTPNRRGMSDIASEGDIHALLNNMNPQQIAQLISSAGGGQSASSLASLLNSTRSPSSGGSTNGTAGNSAPTSAGSSSAAASTRANRMPAQDFQYLLSNLRPDAAGQQEPSQSQVQIDLSSVMTVDSLKDLLENNEFMSQVEQHLPNTRQEDEPMTDVREQFERTVRSPQFRSALSQFCVALSSGQLGPLVAQFGLSDSCVAAANQGDLEAFVKALEEMQRQQSGGVSSDMDTNKPQDKPSEKQ
ncbi:Proteasomal ubiquitin receptor ADRM1, partial [Fragariocoptes setiger]